MNSITASDTGCKKGTERMEFHISASSRSDLYRRWQAASRADAMLVTSSGLRIVCLAAAYSHAS